MVGKNKIPLSLQSGTKLVETHCPKGHFRGLLASKGKNEALPSQPPPCNVVNVATVNL